MLHLLKNSDGECRGLITVTFDENTSHSGIVKQLINSLVKAKWASRKEIEKEFTLAIETGMYKRTTD